MAVQTWVGRFCVTEAGVQEEGRWLTSLVRQHPDEQADELYVLVEPASPASAELTAQLTDVVAHLYQRDTLSLTGALTRAMQAAHEHLRDWNRRALKEHQIGAGATCMAVRGPEVYLAQVGPALAYVCRADGAVRRFEPEEADFERALGVAERFAPRITRVHLAPGDAVLVASTALDRVVPRDHLERLMRRGADDALGELYRLCRDQQDFALVLLACFEPEPEPERPPAYLLTDEGQRQHEQAGQPDAETDASGERDDAGATILAGAPATTPAGARTSVSAGASADWPPAYRPIKEQVREITESASPPPSANVRVRGAGAAPRYKRTTGASLPQIRVPKLAVFAALALAFVGLLLYWQLPGSVQEDREARFAELVASAREANARAQASAEPGLKRQLLTDAQLKLGDAEKIHGDDPTVTSLKADVAAALAVLDAVYEASDLAPVVELAQTVSGDLSVTRAVLGGGHAYLLDAQGSRVLRVPLDGSAAPETVLKAGDFAGFVTIGKPVQITWLAENESLAIIDDARQGFVYFPERGSLPMTVRALDSLASITAVTASGGNLYVLDVEQDQVWRYLPGQGGFDSERTALLDGVDLANATDVAVGQDVYVLDQVAGVRRFVGKAEAPFELAGIDRPLASPVRIAVLPGSNRIVIADRGNNRIVIASADGVFLRQIVSPAFTDLRAVAVDEGAGVMYVLNGETLMRGAFPP